jgi:hypothetical protein
VKQIDLQIPSQKNEIAIFWPMRNHQSISFRAWKIIATPAT